MSVPVWSVTDVWVFACVCCFCALCLSYCCRCTCLCLSVDVLINGMKRSLQTTLSDTCTGPGKPRLLEQKSAVLGAGGTWLGWGVLRCPMIGCGRPYNQHLHVRDLPTDSRGEISQSGTAGGVVTPVGSGSVSSLIPRLTDATSTDSSTRRTLDFSNTPSGHAESRAATRKLPSVKRVEIAGREATVPVGHSKSSGRDEHLPLVPPATTNLPNATRQGPLSSSSTCLLSAARQLTGVEKEKEKSTQVSEGEKLDARRKDEKEKEARI